MQLKLGYWNDVVPVNWMSNICRNTAAVDYDKVKCDSVNHFGVECWAEAYVAIDSVYLSNDNVARRFETGIQNGVNAMCQPNRTNANSVQWAMSRRNWVNKQKPSEMVDPLCVLCFCRTNAGAKHHNSQHRWIAAMQDLNTPTPAIGRKSNIFLGELK